MPTANDVIVNSLVTSQLLLRRFMEDLTPEEYLHRITPTANCAAWTIGHLILSDRRVAASLGATDLPALPTEFEKRFGRDEGSPQAGTFGDVSILMPLFDAHRDKLIDIVKKSTPQQLDTPLEKPRPMFKTRGEMANFMGLHTATHAGQITFIRRSLGRAPII